MINLFLSLNAHSGINTVVHGATGFVHQRRFSLVYLFVSWDLFVGRCGYMLKCTRFKSLIPEWLFTYCHSWRALMCLFTMDYYHLTNVAQPFLLLRCSGLPSSSISRTTIATEQVASYQTRSSLRHSWRCSFSSAWPLFSQLELYSCIRTHQVINSVEKHYFKFIASFH